MQVSKEDFVMHKTGQFLFKNYFKQLLKDLQGHASAGCIEKLPDIQHKYNVFIIIIQNKDEAVALAHFNRLYFPSF